MFDQIFERSDALRRQLAGPLREARLAYLHHRAEQGAPRSTLRKLAQYLLVIAERLNLGHDGTVPTAQIERAAGQWARRQVQHHKIKGGFSRKSKSCFVCVATNWVRFLGRLQSPETRPHRLAQLVDDFARYMEQEKGLAPRTITTRSWLPRTFSTVPFTRSGLFMRSRSAKLMKSWLTKERRPDTHVAEFKPMLRA